MAATLLATADEVIEWATDWWPLLPLLRPHALIGEGPTSVWKQTLPPALYRLSWSGKQADRYEKRSATPSR